MKKTKKKGVTPKKVIKKPVETVVEPVKGKYDHYDVELIAEGPLSGEYRFKTKGSREHGWQVSARNLDEAYAKAQVVPAGLRN